MGGVHSQMKGRDEDIPSAAMFFALRSALHPAIGTVLGPFMNSINPKTGLKEPWSPATKFDVTQRASRAMFAAYFVVQGIRSILKELKKSKLKDEEQENHTMVTHDKHTRRLISQFCGFVAADTVDVLCLWGKHGVFQADILQHHVVTLAMYLYAMISRRTHWIGITGFLTELLVPCGVVLWWLKAYNSNQLVLKLVRVIGLCILYLWRLPIFLTMLRCLWLTKSQSMHTALRSLLGIAPAKDADAAPAAGTPSQPRPQPSQQADAKPESRDAAGARQSLLQALVRGDVRGIRSKCLPEVFVYTCAIFFGLYLDYGWGKLYMQGLTSK